MERFADGSEVTLWPSSERADAWRALGGHRCLEGTQELEQKPACLSFVIQHVTLSSSSQSLRHASCCFRPWGGPPGDVQMVTVGLDTIVSFAPQRYS